MGVDAILAKVFGTKHEREVKALRPTIQAIGEMEPRMQEMSDEELEQRIKEKLGRYMGKADIVDVEALDLDKELPGPDEEEKE